MEADHGGHHHVHSTAFVDPLLRGSVFSGGLGMNEASNPSKTKLLIIVGRLVLLCYQRWITCKLSNTRANIEEAIVPLGSWGTFYNWHWFNQRMISLSLIPISSQWIGYHNKEELVGEEKYHQQQHHVLKSKSFFSSLVFQTSNSDDNCNHPLTALQLYYNEWQWFKDASFYHLFLFGFLTNLFKSRTLDFY